MTRYFLGIDTGGTKSHALIADETGQALALFEGGPGNHESIGYDGLAATLQTIADGALSAAGIERSQIAGAGFGIAGYDWPSEREPTLEVIRTLNLHAPLELVNDAVIGLLAGAAEGWGVNIGAGTGCNCRGRDREGREGRVTGMGGFMGEYGGAGELVGRAIQAVSRAWSLRGSQTSLTRIFVDHVGARDVMDLLEGLCERRYRLKAAAAPLVFQAAASGDQVAEEAIRWVSRELGNLGVGVIRQLKFESLDFEVILAGSFYKGSPMVMDEIARTIHEVAPKARFVRLTVPPVVGALVLAMEQVGLKNPGVRDKLIETTRKFYSYEQ